jgi:hypothetical protein
VDGFFLNDFQRCQPLDCDPPCTSCLNKTLLGNQCLTCQAGFYLDNFSCFPCLEGCQSCDFANMCNRCKPGYYLSEDLSCVACTFPCQECRGPNPLADCLSCFDGYKYYDYYGACGYVGQCEYPCQTCVRGPSSCGTCVEGYTKVNGTCL